MGRKQRLAGAAVGLMILMQSSFSPAAAQQLTVTTTLSSQSDSGVSGTATLTDLGNGTLTVDLRVTGSGPDARPAHIHQGSCPTETAPEYALTAIVDGVSRTQLAASLADLLTTPHAIDVHRSAEDIGIHVACGDLVSAATSAQQPASMANLASQSGSGISGTATLTDLGSGRVIVDLRTNSTDAGVRPVHIHQGSCPTDTPPQYSLTPLVQGFSTTEVSVALDDLLATPHAIDIHASAEDIGIHVACGDLIRAADTEYNVVEGDTLSTLAQRWLGDANRWPAVYAANRDRITNPNRIVPGQLLRVTH